MHVAGQLTIEGGTAAIAIDQNLARPFVYLSTRERPVGFVMIDISNVAEPRFAAEWHVDDDTSLAAQDLTTFSLGDRHYLAQAFQHATDKALSDLGAIIFDVSGGLRINEVVRIKAQGGYESLFAYRHSNGRSLLLASGGGSIYVYDLEVVVEEGGALAATVATPSQLETSETGFDNVFAGFEPDTQQDRLYAAGAGGYYVYDLTDPSSISLLTSISSAAVQRGRTMIPTPDGRYVLTTADYRTAPIRIFDLQPGLDGTLPRIRTAVSAWTSNWQNEYQGIQLRWPLAFVAALEDGLQVVNVRDMLNPYTDAYYRTTPPLVEQSPPLMQAPGGTFDVDVRNADGLIVASDLDTGFWAFTLDAFSGWHGHAWGLPNMSSVQDWGAGPDGR